MLLELSEKSGYCDLSEIGKVCHELMVGCDQMLNRLKYWPTHNKNNASVETKEWGPQVIDAMATWLKQKIIAGPFEEAPQGAMVVKVTCRPKPTGSARVIMNLRHEGNNRCSESLWQGCRLYQNRLEYCI
jgi:hypothetical protein